MLDRMFFFNTQHARASSPPGLQHLATSSSLLAAPVIFSPYSFGSIHITRMPGVYNNPIRSLNQYTETIPVMLLRSLPTNRLQLDCCAPSAGVVCRVWAEDHKRRISRVAELQGRRDAEGEDTPEEIGTDDDDDDDDEEEEEEEGGSGRLVYEGGDLMGCVIVVSAQIFLFLSAACFSCRG